MKDKNNIMRTVKLEKVVLNVGGVGEKLDKGFILLGKLTGKKPIRIKATKRIPTWGVRPGLELGTKITLRGKDAVAILKKVLPAINNTIKERQIRPNSLSFGIKEYIEIPGIEYIREVGIMGFEITAVFARAGKRVERKKTKSGKLRRTVQDVTPKEIEDFMDKNFKTKILKKRKKEAGE